MKTIETRIKEVLQEEASRLPSFDEAVVPRARPRRESGRRKFVGWAAAALAGLALILSPVLLRSSQDVAHIPDSEGGTGTEKGELVLTADQAAQALLASVDSNLALQVLNDDDTVSLGSLSPSADVEISELESGELGPLTVDASGHFVVSQPTSDFQGFGATELWVGRTNGDQWRLVSFGTSFSFHTSEPGRLAYLNTQDASPVIRIIDLAEGPATSEAVATVPDAVAVRDWTTAGILAATRDGGGVLITPEGDQITINSQVVALSSNGTVLTTDPGRSRIRLIDAATQAELIVIDLSGSQLMNARWLPHHEAFGITTHSDGVYEARLIDLLGTTIDQIQFSSSISPAIAEWENLLVFGSAEGLRIWDPTTSQTGRIDSTKELVPLRTIEQP